MAGIVSYGAYIPRYRIDRKLIYKSMGWLNPAAFMKGEKAVANFDEDSVTMAVAAGIDCLAGIDRKKVEAVFFASTTPLYMERQSAGIIATAFDLRAGIRTADLTDTVKAGTSAVLSALDAVNAGSLDNVIVCTSDCRTGKAGSIQEQMFGDGAAALMFGKDDIVAEFKGSFSVSYDFVDHWRGRGEQYDRQWEDRFIRDEGYTKFIIEVLNGLSKKCSVELTEMAKVIYPCLYPGDFKKIARITGLSESQMEEPLIGRVGYTGTADPLLHLVKALESAKAGDRIAVVGWGGGADAMLFEVTDKIENIQNNRCGISKYLTNKRPLESYEKMVTFRGLLDVEKGIRGEAMPFSAFSELWRMRRQIFGLCGSRCTACGTPQYPAQRVCVNPDCGIIDQMESYRFSDRRGTLFTYTADSLAFTPNPPSIYCYVDFEGGGRYWFDLADVDLEDLKVDMPVEMTFRKKFTDNKFAVYSYHWKAVPIIS